MSFDLYWRRFGFAERQIAVEPPPSLGISVVIPCCEEPDLLRALEALWACDPPESAVEVLLVVNSAETALADVRRQNEITLQQAACWREANPHPRMTLHCLHFSDLPRKHAGVGLARKIGMDEAARRFADLRKLDRGVIACFDADCRCDKNYLVSLERHFAHHLLSPGCSIYFEHPLTDPWPTPIQGAIARYELHLRYYVHGLRLAGFPCAFHTVGSAMAVRADAYLQQGGMNRRQAGEDFYFLHKIIPLGRFTELTETRVIPSPRPSHRVPFGTGRAVQHFLRTGEFRTYPLESFLELRELFRLVPGLYRSRAALSDNSLPSGAALRAFLHEEGFEAALTEIRANTASFDSFRNRFFGWFNGFRAMKCIHHLRDHGYGDRDVLEAARALLGELAPGRETRTLSLVQALEQFRRLDRQPWTGPARDGGPARPERSACS